MSETINESFKLQMMTEIKKIQTELNELKNIKDMIKPSKKTATKKKVVKRKPSKKTATKKKTKRR